MIVVRSLCHTYVQSGPFISQVKKLYLLKTTKIVGNDPPDRLLCNMLPHFFHLRRCQLRRPAVRWFKIFSLTDRWRCYHIFCYNIEVLLVSLYYLVKASTTLSKVSFAVLKMKIISSFFRSLYKASYQLIVFIRESYHFLVMLYSQKVVLSHNTLPWRLNPVLNVTPNFKNVIGPHQNVTYSENFVAYSGCHVLRQIFAAKFVKLRSCQTCTRMRYRKCSSCE